MKRPRIIRLVVKVGKDGRPKRVRDRKAEIDIERVRAHGGSHHCSYPSCPQGNYIRVGTEFAMVYRPQWTKRIGPRRVPAPRDYHFACLPEDVRPLLRFFGQQSR